MFKPQRYIIANAIQRDIAKDIINDFKSSFKWRNDGKDSLLDVGCGSGDITNDFIRSAMPKKFHRLVGVDVSKDMIEYANKKYGTPNTSFHVFDLEVDLQQQSLREAKPFPHITSFNCLHWVKNQQKAMQSIYDLLESDGNLLMCFATNLSVYETFLDLSKNPSWNEYMYDVEKYISPYRTIFEDPTKKVRSFLNSFKFSNYVLDLRNGNAIFEHADEFITFLKSFDPFIDRIPMKDQAAYLQEHMNHTSVLKWEKYQFNYQYVVVHAKK